MGSELATAYANLVISTGGQGQRVIRELGGAGSAAGAAAGKGFAGSFLAGGAIAGIAASVTSSLTGAFGGFIKEAAEASDATDKFKATMNFAGLKTDAIDKAAAAAKKYADETVFDLPTIQNTIAQLASNGIKDYTGLTKAAGNLNAVAGGNAESFKSVAMVMTQTAGSGKLTTENWNQLTDAVAGAAGPLMKSMKDAGAYTGNFRDAMEKGEITAEEFNAAILKLGNQPVAVEAAKSTKTFEGAIGNLQATINSGLMSALNAMKPALTGAINGLTSGLGGAFDAVGKAATGLGQKAAPALNEIKGGVTAMIAAYKDGGSDVTSSGFAGVLERVGLIAREGVGSVKAFFAAFAAGGDDVTSSGFAGFMEQLGLNMRKVFDAIGPAIAPLMPVIGQLAAQALQLVSSFSPLGLIFQALGPVLPQIVTLLGQLAGSALGALAAVMPSVTAMAGQLVAILSGAFVQLMPVVSTIITALGQAFTTLAPVIGQVVAAVAPLVSSLVGMLVPIITQLVSSVLPPVVSIFSAIVGAIGPVVNILLAVLVPAIQALMPVVTTVFGVIANVITSVMQIIQGVIQVVTGVISGNWSQVWEGIKNVFGGIWNAIGSIITGAINIVRSIIGAGLSFISSLWNSAWNGIKSFFSGLWSSLTGAISSGINNVVSFFQGLPGRILGAVAGLTNSLVQVGRDMIQGLINGIGGMVQNAVNAVMDVGGKMLSGVKGLLGIHSPSREFAKIGTYIIQGLTSGVKKTAPQATAAINAVAKKVTDSATKHFTKADQLRKAASSLMSRAAQVSGAKAPTLGNDAKANAKKMTAYYAAISKRNKRVSDLVAQGRQKLAEATRETSLGRTLDATSRMISASNKQISKLTTQRASIASRLKTAQKSLSDAVKTRDKAASDAAEKFRDEFDLGNLAGRDANGILLAVKRTVSNVAAFKGQLDKLRSLGLDASLMAQIGDLGSEKGGAFAKALIAGGKGVVSQLNGQWKQLGSVSQSAGMSLANGMYGAGIAAQQGLVKGLSGNLKAIDAAVKKITDRMTSQVKKNLGIHSPSRVFRYEVGRQVPAGLALGVRDGMGLVTGAVDALVQIPRAIASQPYVPASFVPAVPGSFAGQGSGGFTVNGDVYGATPVQIVDEVERRKRRANALAGIGRV
ncbi:tape measure protein [Arthrobacter sp. RCC_34]|uniref:tape measure protein n=1 Tax=Arthrobacter sp. RCC_34 TaxID=3239230 RepID=UPI003525B1C0